MDSLHNSRRAFNVSVLSTWYPSACTYISFFVGKKKEFFVGKKEKRNGTFSFKGNILFFEKKKTWNFFLHGQYQKCMNHLTACDKKKRGHLSSLDRALKHQQECYLFTAVLFQGVHQATGVGQPQSDTLQVIAVFLRTHMHHPASSTPSPITPPVSTNQLLSLQDEVHYCISVPGHIHSSSWHPQRQINVSKLTG